ncbi:MAG TPA: hypothetical protein VJJ02_04520 [Candidatus Paceibacterota bacterium]
MPQAEQKRKEFSLTKSEYAFFGIMLTSEEGARALGLRKKINFLRKQLAETEGFDLHGLFPEDYQRQKEELAVSEKEYAEFEGSVPKEDIAYINQKFPLQTSAIPPK